MVDGDEEQKKKRCEFRRWRQGGSAIATVMGSGGGSVWEGVKEVLKKSNKS